MKSKVSKEEMKKRRDKDQIARDKMVAEGGLMSKSYSEANKTDAKEDASESSNES